MRRFRDGAVMLKHVQTVRQPNGKTRRYLRVPGRKRVALPDLPPDHPDFLTAYAAALRDAPPPTKAAPGTIDDLRIKTLKSARFGGLSKSYKTMMTREFDAISRQGGGAKAGDLRARHVKADLAQLTPVQSKKRLSAWRLLCAVGVETDMLSDDPSEGVKKKKAPKTDGYVPWSVAEIDAFRGRWPNGSIQRWAMELLLWTGARTCDAVALGPGMVGRDGVLAFRQQKTGQLSYVPWTFQPGFAGGRDFLVAALIDSGHMTFLATHGRSRSVKGLGNLISEAARKAGLIDRTAHGLRKSRAIALAEAGATTHEIAAWTGHHSLAEVAHYTAEADRRKAVQGQTKHA